MFKYFSCFMIKSRTFIDVDSSWAFSVFFEWKNKVKIIDHSWFFCSRRNWIFFNLFDLLFRRQKTFILIWLNIHVQIFTRYEITFWWCLYHLRILRFQRRCRFWNLLNFRQRRRFRLNVILTSSHWWNHQWSHHVYLNFIITAINFI
jgi:hypothetical protein